MFRSVRKKSGPVTLSVDALEERCTPAAIQPPLVTTHAPFFQVEASLVLTLVPQQALVRTDLFGGAHDDARPESDLLTVREPFALQESAFDLTPPHQSDAEPAALPADVKQTADDATTTTLDADPITLCVVVEYD